MASPRWLADEMVGRLARYLRFLGQDTEYARGESDENILYRAKVEDRVVLTRDRNLARRADRALYLGSSSLPDQLRAVRSAFPEMPLTPTFDRCTICNGELERFQGNLDDLPPRVPRDRFARGLPLYRCRRCGQFYWEGSHTEKIRSQLLSWGLSPSP